MSMKEWDIKIMDTANAFVKRFKMYVHVFSLAKAISSFKYTGL